MSPRRPLVGSLPYVLAVLFGLAIGWVNVHTDQTPVVALPLLAAAGVLGVIWPRRAWRWGLLVGAWLALGQAYALLTSTRLPYPNNPSDIAAVLGIGLTLGLVGAYSGALVRRLVASAE